MYRKKAIYLESKLNEDNLTQADLVRRAKRLARLQRHLTVPPDQSSREISKLEKLNVEEELSRQDPVLLAYLKTLFYGVKGRRSKKAKVGKNRRLLCAIETLNKAHHNNYIGLMSNLIGKTAYLRSHSKLLVQYLSHVGACGSYTSMLEDIKNLPSIDDVIPEDGACIVILDNCQNDGRKLYHDRVTNAVKVDVVTAIVTMHFERNNSQSMNQGGQWKTGNTLHGNLFQTFRENETTDKKVFATQRKIFINSFLYPNEFQKREDEFMLKAIEY